MNYKSILATVLLAANMAGPVDASATPAARALSALKQALPPKGFSTVCSRYSWACSGRGSGPVAYDSVISVAATINSDVNRSIRPASDYETYGRQEYWTVPTRGVGDCEDYALMKKQRLIKAGIAPNKLLLAQVFTRSFQPHVVLILRTDAGDYVLDNLTSSIRTWQATGYTFAKMQNGRNPSRWDVILLGPNARREG